MIKSFSFRWTHTKQAAALLSLLLIIMAGAGEAPAAEAIRHGSLLIEQPWTRATPPGAPGGAYLTITNKGEAPDRLVSVRSPRAGRAEVHEMKTEGGVMTMRPLADGLDIPAGETVAFGPGGLHIMLMKLDRPIEVGDLVPVTLVFERAGSVTVDFVAGPLGSRRPPAGDGK